MNEGKPDIAELIHDGKVQLVLNTTEGSKAVAAGMNPMDLKRGIDLATAVRTVASQCRDPRLKSVLNQVHQDVANGEPVRFRIVNVANTTFCRLDFNDPTCNVLQ